MSPAADRFIQISVVTPAPGHTVLYALDGTGQVWKLLDNGDSSQQWTKMSNRQRLPAPAAGAAR
jgi:hypothetical protein